MYASAKEERMQATDLSAMVGATPANEIASTTDMNKNVKDIAVDEDQDSQANKEGTQASSTKSLSESITEYRRIHGRTFSQKTDYWGPNDETQNEALDIADFADEFPSAEVIGVDISPIQPPWVPPNCKFYFDDVEQPWTWSKDFDLIHIRHLEASIENWPALYKQAFDHLVPGGFIEVKEFDITTRSQFFGDYIPEDHIFHQWAKVMFEATDKLGKTLAQTQNHSIARALDAIGYVDIVEKRFSIPIGAWPKDPKLKEVGQCNLLYNDQSLEGFALFLLKEVLGWAYPRIVVFVAEMRQALRDPSLQAFFHLHLVYARKPDEVEQIQTELEEMDWMKVENLVSLRKTYDERS
ncbi:UMTA [Colletotrichum abscissum]|uniref:UMTA n=1 Tax=Colletotrichum abscissum TaxID=1671311 RepID=UPI0027D6626B|nr:UMTA [Colletotrichum abscissum]KAK1521266.1 UMTA [Colletotrichum abscissum]